MELHPWPADFREKKSGIGCPQCAQGRVGETEHGIRYFSGDISDGYLQKSGPAAGYSVVVFRGRHVGALHEMTEAEHAVFWSEVSIVATAIDRVYEPVHLNFQVLGNQDPHVHVHVIPRYDPDPAPSMPLPAEAWSASTRLDRTQLSRRVEDLRAAVAAG